MNCVENLKSKREIQIKLKQFFSTNDWVSLKSSPYSNGSCSWLKDMARTEHLYLSLVCRSDEAALKTSLTGGPKESRLIGALSKPITKSNG